MAGKLTICMMMDNHCYGTHDDNADGYFVVISLAHVLSSHVSVGWCHVEATEDNDLSHVNYCDQNDHGIDLY